MHEIDLCVVGGRICAEEEEEQKGSILTVRYLANKGDSFWRRDLTGRGWWLGVGVGFVSLRRFSQKHCNKK